MISVGFNRQAYIMQAYGGISRYFTDLYLGLGEQQGIEAKFLFRHHQNAYLLQQGIGRKLSSLQAKFYVHTMLRCKPNAPISSYVDIQHSTYYLGKPQKPNGSARLTSTLYDMIPELMPKYFKENPHPNKIDWLKASDLIISISDTAASDLAYFQPKIASKILRIHLYSCFKPQSPQSKPESIQETQDPYFLFVGQRGRYKNTSLLLRAFASSEPKRHGHKLLFAGGGSLSGQEQKEIGRLELSSHVAQVAVSDSELWYLYRKASAVLVPSLAEGFSLPLVEGLAADVPVICSDIPVHREVAKGFALFISPLQHGDWADALRAAGKIPQPSLALGLPLYHERLKYFSRERMVEEHVHAYKSLVS